MNEPVGTFYSQTIAFCVWPLKAHVHLKIQSAFSASSRISIVLTVPTLFISSSPKILVRLKAKR
jgi:hypothetical protein